MPEGRLRTPPAVDNGRLSTGCCVVSQLNAIPLGFPLTCASNAPSLFFFLVRAPHPHTQRPVLCAILNCTQARSEAGTRVFQASKATELFTTWTIKHKPHRHTLDVAVFQKELSSSASARGSISSHSPTNTLTIRRVRYGESDPWPGTLT